MIVNVLTDDGTTVEIIQGGLPNVVEVFESTTPNVVEVVTAGPQGPPGLGANINTGSLLTTASFNSYTGSSTSQFAGTASYAINALTASYLSGYVSPFPYTGSAQITGSLEITGSLSTTGSDASFNGVTVGRGLNSISTNVAVGALSLNNNTTGFVNTAIGYNALGVNTGGFANTVVGSAGLSNLASGYNNVGVGYNTTLAANSNFNSIVIGSGAVGLGSNTVVIGDIGITLTALRGNIALGKTTANARLDISGSALISGSLNVTQGITGSLFGTASYAATASNIQGGTASYIPLWNTATSLSSSTIYQDGTGNLGIGITSPLGILHLYKPAATTRMVMDGDAGQSKIITFRTNRLQRFGLYCNSTAESGANAGSDFVFRAYNDAGTLLSTPLFIKRSSGNIGIGTTAPGAKLDVHGNAIITGSLVVTGSLRGNVIPSSIASTTASLDLATSNFFTLTLDNGANTHISASNIQPGQTVNIRVTQGSAGTGTVSFNSAIKQSSGSLYTGSMIANAVDVVSLIAFDSSNAYISYINNFV